MNNGLSELEGGSYLPIQENTNTNPTNKILNTTNNIEGTIDVANKTLHEQPNVPSNALTKHDIKPESVKLIFDKTKCENEKEIKQFENNIRNIFIKKIAGAILIGVAAVLLTAGLGAVCAFCPPLAVIIVGVGVVALACGVTGFGVKLAVDQPNLSPEKQDLLQKQAQSLEEAGELFERYKIQTPPDGTSFEEFLETCPKTYSSSMGGDVYKVEDLENFITRFKNKKGIEETSKKIETLSRDIEEKSLLVENNKEAKKNVKEAVEELKKEELEFAKTNMPSDFKESQTKLKNLNEEIENLKKQKHDLQDKNESSTHLDEPILIKEKEREDFIQKPEGRLAHCRIQLKEQQEQLDLFQQAEETLENQKKELEELKKRQGVLEQENIQLANSIPSMKGQIEDKRLTSPELKKWKEQEIKIPTERSIVKLAEKGEKDVFLFGVEDDAPTHGIQGNDPEDNKKELKGDFLKNMPFKELGRTESNNFLSMAYTKDLTIEGKTYPSVVHYLVSKLIEKRINEISSEEKETLQDLRNLNDRLQKEPALKAYHTAIGTSLLPTKKHDLDIIQPFLDLEGLDDELKTALYHKFIGPDGKPTEEGEKLLKTEGNLYAGNELGDPSYGMVFIDSERMTGHNKLGIYLMELRNLMKNSKGD